MSPNMTGSLRPRAPFFGRCMMETVENGNKKEAVRKRKERDARLRELFQAVDDYVEQA